MLNKVIIALDVKDKSDVKRIIKKTENYVKTYKIGLQLFTAFGPEIVNMVIKGGLDVFLDLKLHDIPNTVYNAVESITKNMHVKFLTVHTLGGTEMLKAAVESARNTAIKYRCMPPKIIGVTVLTSINKDILKNELKVEEKIGDYVVKLARIAKESGIDGVIASGEEVKSLRESLGDDLMIFVPGIRLNRTESNDQKRVITPSLAIKYGADYIVIGRPVIEAKDPEIAIKKILNNIEANAQ